MFSVQQKRDIADAVQKILRETDHPELPVEEIQFALHVEGATMISWALIKNNGAVPDPSVNLHNEAQDPKSALHPDCRIAWDRGLTDYPIEEHTRDCEKCQEWQRNKS